MMDSTSKLPLTALFRRRMLAGGLVVMVLSAALLLVYLMHTQRQAASLSLGVSAELSAEQIETFVRSHEAAVALLAALAPADADWPPLLEQTRARFDGFLTMVAIDADGIVLAGVPTARADGTAYAWAGNDVTDRPYFRTPRDQRRPYVSGVFRGRGYGTDPIVAVSAPVFDADGALSHVVQGTFGSRAFTDLRAEALRKRMLSLLVLDAEQQVVFASPDLRWEPLQTFEPALDGVASGTLPGAYRDGSDGRFAQVRIHAGWSVLVLQSQRIQTAALQRDAVRLLLPALLGLLAIAVAISAMAQRLSRPITRLAVRMRALDFRGAVQREHEDGESLEVHTLSVAFNELVERLRLAHADTQAALEEQLKLHRQLQEAVEDREQVIRARTEALREANQRLQALTVTDELTGTLNYRGFREVADTMWERVGHGTLAAIAGDIDHFKKYNDHYGHPAGDACLQRVAAAMRSALLRPEDRVCRVGGEEFVVLVPGLSLAEACMVAERMRAAVAQLGIPHARSPLGTVTMSLGVAVLAGNDHNDPSMLLKAADEALYRAKEAGRNRVST